MHLALIIGSLGLVCLFQVLFAAYSLLDDKKMTTSEISRFYCYYYETKQKYLLLTFPRLSVGLAVLLLLVSRPPAGEAEVEAAALGGPRARARAVAPHQPGGGARGRGGARAAAGDCQLSAEVRIEVTLYVCLSLFTQGGDTRREEVLPKGIVDISIHITSHASVTAQN